MFHAKFHDHRTISSVEEDFTIYGHGGHLGHVTWIIQYTNFLSPFHMKFGLDRQSGFREEDVENNGHIHVYSPGAGAGADPGVNHFSLKHLFSQFSPLLQVFHIK